MKYSEVIKAFENGSTKTYEATDNYKRHEMSVSGSGYFYYKNFYEGSGKEIESFVPAGGFSGNICRTLDWHEVTQPVTFQEAFKSWVSGYKVSFTDKQGLRYEVDPLEFKVGDDFITRDEVDFCKWYVEDES